jgi:hypothetical protein
MPALLQPDLEQARRFLHAFDPSADYRFILDGVVDGFTFQTFDDDKERKSLTLARIHHGIVTDKAKALTSLNQQGAGVFFTVNETDMQGRKLSNITRIRANWVEDDTGGTAPETPLQPHFIVETSPGKFHKYFLVDGLTTEQHQQIQQTLVNQYGSDPNAKDAARVLRVPGFFHNKNKPFMVRLMHESGEKPYTAAEMLAAFPSCEKNSYSHKLVKQSPQPSHVHDEIVMEGGRNSYLTSQAGSMRRRGMGGEAIRAALIAENNSKCSPPLDESEVEQIARSISKYEPSANPLADQQAVESAINQMKHDPGAVFEPSAIAAFQRLKANHPAEFQRQRSSVKKNKASGVSLSDFDHLIKGSAEDYEETTAHQLVSLIKRRCELFHSPERRGYASIKIADEHGEHQEHWPIDSPGFQEWLCHEYYKETKATSSSGIGVVPSEANIKQALLTANGIAKHEGAEETVWLRCAPYQNGYIIDLCDECWRVVEVLPTGWRVLTDSPVKFWRSTNMRPLPLPGSTGNLEALWRFCNIPESGRVLVLAWVLESWRPDTPCPGLELVGTQGTAKSSTQERLRQIIDPNKVNLRSAPKSVEDIFVAAACNWLTSFNNLSHLTAQQQDALCTLATGGGYATRTFYTNTEETVIEAKRPWVINGIVPLVTAQDLNDRVIHIELMPVEYIEEAEIAERWEADLPSILSGLFDLFSETLKVLPDVKLDRLPRMADFARLGTAMMQALGEQGEFMALYESNRKDSISRGLEASPVACAVSELANADTLETPVVFEGTLKQLLEVLSRSHRQSGEHWPKSPRGLGDILRRQAPALKTMGVTVIIESKPKRDGYHVKITTDRPIINPIDELLF